MSRKITISSIGAEVTDTILHGHDAVNYMCNFWQTKIYQVLPDKPDLIVLPECCDRFSKHTMEERKAYYTFRGNKIRDFFAAIAAKNNCYIAYSSARKMNDGTYRNSTQLIDRTGKICGCYNKNYLVPCETIDGGILPGKDSPVLQTDFGKVALAICFDLNYHELLCRYAKQKPDLIIFPSRFHGGLMQNYWAYNCQSYFISAVAGLESSIINPVGEIIAHSTNYFDYVTEEVNLDCQVIHLDENWEKITAAKKKYGHGIKMFDPGKLGCVLLTSELDDLSIQSIINEFNIEIWDDYYNRSIEHHKNNMEE